MSPLGPNNVGGMGDISGGFNWHEAPTKCERCGETYDWRYLERGDGYCQSCIEALEEIDSERKEQAEDEGHAKECGLWLGESCNCFQSRPDPNDSNR